MVTRWPTGAPTGQEGKVRDTHTELVLHRLTHNLCLYILGPFFFNTLGHVPHTRHWASSLTQ